jgi:hypothetical protein
MKVFHQKYYSGYYGVWYQPRALASKTLDMSKDPDKNYRTLENAMAKLFKNYPPVLAKPSDALPIRLGTCRRHLPNPADISM